MILILSETQCETSTEDIVDWLEGRGVSSFRLNGKDLDGDAVIGVEISGGRTQFRLELDDEALELEEVRAVWFRRWIRDRQHEMADLFASKADSKLEYDLTRHLTLESRRLSDFLFSRLEDRPWLSDPETSQVKKLRVLELAARIGFDIPATLVTNKRDELQKFLEEHGALITKPISEAQIFLDREHVHFMYTSVLERTDIEALPRSFFPSLFQAQIKKKFELRVFYLEGECYAMAIFSQRDPQTRSDFRRYNSSRPNRNVPYRLSPQTEDNIRKLMGELELETGSVDLIKTPDGREVFLEVNAVGQFGMVSKPCNYHLERRMADALIRRANHGKK